MAELKTIFTADTSGLNSAIGKAQSGIGGLASKLGAMFAGTAALGYVKSLIDAQSAIKDTADAVGVSTTMLQGMREMGKDVGVEFGKIQTALNKIDASRLDAIKDKTGGTAQAFAALGLSAEKLAGMNTEQTIMAMGAAYAASGKGAAELSAMVELLGAKNMALLPVFEQLGTDGAAAFDKLAAAGRISSEQTIDDMDKLGDKLGEIGSRIGNFLSKGISAFVRGWEDLSALAGHMSVSPDNGGVTGMEAIDLIAETRRKEGEAASSKRNVGNAAVIESQKQLLSAPDKASAKLLADNARMVLAQSSMSDSVLRIGGGSGRNVAQEDTQLLKDIKRGIDQLVVKDTAPRMR